MKILFLQKRLLFPMNAGWRIRTLNVVRHLARWHQVTYLCNLQAEDEPYVPAMTALGVELITEPWVEARRGGIRFYRDLAANLFSPYPFTVDKDFDPALRRRVATLLASRSYDLVVCDFVQMARNVLGLPMPASMLFQHNVETQLLERHTRGGGSFARRAYMHLQSRKMRRFEGRACGAFDLVVAVSDGDRRLLQSLFGLSNVRLIDTAVDVDYFRPQTVPTTAGRVVFVGSLDWLPNEDGLAHFVSSIWPHIQRHCPDAEFDIVGRNPSPSLKRLARAPGIRLSANVPDVRPHLSRARVSVVPLRIGGGTRLKVFESLAMGVPVVSTSIGAEGLPVVSGTHVVIADEPEAFAHAVVGLLGDGPARDRLAQAGRSLVEARFSAETVARQFEGICREAVERRPGGASLPHAG